VSKEESQEKPLIELTTDELLDWVFPKPLADKLREIAHQEDDDDDDDD
jgi:hypothetical protein